MERYLLTPKFEKSLFPSAVGGTRHVTHSNSVFPTPFFKDEAESTISCCIALVQELIDAERAIRAGKPFDVTMLNGTRQWVWERFGNLERGPMSNGGVARPERKS